jgi:hypothetical protein
MRAITIRLVLPVFLLITASCENPVCNEQGISTLNIGFFSRTIPPVGDTVIEALPVRITELYIPPGEVKFITPDSARDLSRIGLPLLVYDSEVTYVITRDSIDARRPARTDTIQFSFEHSLVVPSFYCKPVVRYDSIKVVNSTFAPGNIQVVRSHSYLTPDLNVQIFY